MKKVLLIMPVSTLDFGKKNAGGVDSVCQELLKTMTNEPVDRYEYRVLAFDHTSVSNYNGQPLQLTKNISIVVAPENEYLGPLFVPGILSQLYRVQQQIKNFQPDIVHSHQLPWLIGVSNKHFRIATLHSYKWIGRKKVNLLNDLLYVHILPAIAKRFVDQFTCVGSALKKTLASETNTPAVVIDNPLNDTFFKVNSLEHKPTDQIKLITCSIINPKKRIDLVLLLLRDLRDHGIDVCLSIVGPTNNKEYYEQLKNLIETYNLTSRVYFLGQKNSVEIAKLYSSHHAGVFLSEEETFGLAPLEMLAANLPTIATPVGYLGEKRHIFEGHGVLYFDGSAPPVFEFIKNLSTARGKVPYSHMKKDLSSSSIVKKYENLYEHAIKTGSTVVDQA